MWTRLRGDGMELRRLIRDSVLAAAALAIFVVELHLPDLVPIPGVKLGLANIVTLITLYALSPWDALAVLTVRVLLGALFSGNMMALLYSAAGGLLAFFVMAALRPFTSTRQLWAVSALAAIAHNLGQIAAAILVTSTPSLLVYLPVLAVSGVITGLFTGFAAQFALPRIKKVLKDGK